MNIKRRGGMIGNEKVGCVCMRNAHARPPIPRSQGRGRSVVRMSRGHKWIDASQPIKQPIKRSINHPINHLIHQSIDQSINQPTTPPQQRPHPSRGEAQKLPPEEAGEPAGVGVDEPG